jgi:hypothetical protein
MEHIVFEVGLALTLVAGAALLSARLRFSVVPFLILAGMVVGPHMPKLGIVDLRFIQSAPLIEFMGRLGDVSADRVHGFGRVMALHMGVVAAPVCNSNNSYCCSACSWSEGSSSSVHCRRLTTLKLSMMKVSFLLTDLKPTPPFVKVLLLKTNIWLPSLKSLYLLPSTSIR